MPTIGNLVRCLTRGADRHTRLTGKRGPRGFMTTKCQSTGYFRKSFFMIVPEKIPEIIVPDLKDCQLNAYVSHKCPTTFQGPVTTKEIFDACMASQVIADFKAGKYDSPEDLKLSKTEEAAQS